MNGAVQVEGDAVVGVVTDGATTGGATGGVAGTGGDAGPDGGVAWAPEPSQARKIEKAPIRKLCIDPVIRRTGSGVDHGEMMRWIVPMKARVRTAVGDTPRRGC